MPPHLPLDTKVKLFKRLERDLFPAPRPPETPRARPWIAAARQADGGEFIAGSRARVPTFVRRSGIIPLSESCRPDRHFVAAHPAAVEQFRPPQVGNTPSRSRWLPYAVTKLRSPDGCRHPGF